MVVKSRSPVVYILSSPNPLCYPRVDEHTEWAKCPLLLPWVGLMKRDLNRALERNRARRDEWPGGR